MVAFCPRCHQRNEVGLDLRKIKAASIVVVCGTCKKGRIRLKGLA